jgi:hypothetical protein
MFVFDELISIYLGLTLNQKIAFQTAKTAPQFVIWASFFQDRCKP